MEIKLAEKKNIPEILEIIKNRCDWFEKNHIEQWGNWYYQDLYNEKYFLEAMKKYSLYYLRLECMRINPKINEYYKNHGFQDKGQGNEPYEYRLWEKEII